MGWSLVNKLTTVLKQLDILYIKAKAVVLILKWWLREVREGEDRERQGQSENQGLHFPPNYS